MAFYIKYLGVCLSIRRGALLANKPIFAICEVEFCFKQYRHYLHTSTLACQSVKGCATLAGKGQGLLCTEYCQASIGLKRITEYMICR